MARKNIVFVYDPDPRYYVTRERDAVRAWFRVWFLNHDEATTQRDDMDQLVAVFLDLGLDPSRLRLPTEEERRPRRG